MSIYVDRISGSQPLSPLERADTPLEVRNFLTHLQTAEDIFKEFDRVPENDIKSLDPLKQGANTIFAYHLESAYSALTKIENGMYVEEDFFADSGNLRKMSRLFFLLGHLAYKPEMENSRYFFQASLLLKFASLGFCQADNVVWSVCAHPSTTELKKNWEKGKTGSPSIVTDLPEKIVGSVAENSILDIHNKEHVFELSCILRMLGHTCQNIDDLRKDKEDKARFDLIYGLAKKCNQNVIDQSASNTLIEKAKWEMCELLYNTEPFLQDFIDPKDILKKIALLDNIKPYLNIECSTPKDTAKVNQRSAQIENMKAIEKNRIPGNNPHLILECYQHSCKSLQIAETTPNFDPTLLNMFRNNNNAFALKAKKMGVEIDLKQLEERMNTVLEYSKANPYFYNAIYYTGAARLLVELGKKDKAILLLDTADQVADASKENANAQKEAIRSLRNEILGIKNS